MKTDLFVVTEASDKYFQYSLTSTCSFLEKNDWFRGNLFFLISSKNPLSKTNREILHSIYPKVSFLEVESSSLFRKAYTKFHSSHHFPMASLQDMSKLACLDLFEDSVFYFSNFCLFMNDISPLLEANGDFVFSTNANLFYLKRDFDGLDSLGSKLDELSLLRLGETYSLICKLLMPLGHHVSPTGLIENSNVFTDNKFIQFQAKIKRAVCIYFDNLLSQETSRKNSIVLSPSRSNSKINRVWLQKSGEYFKHATSVRSNFVYNYLETSASSLIKTHTADFNRKVNKLIRESATDELLKYRLDKSKLVESIRESEILTNSGFCETHPTGNYETACVIAFKGRHQIVELNVESLCKQTLVPAIILVASNIIDAAFCEELRKKHKNVFVTLHQNYPIGGKWQAGVDYARRLGVNGLMILGSDDLLSLNYFEECYSNIDRGRGSSGTGYDLVGNRSWYIYDTSRNLYFLEYTKDVTIFLGGGKMFSKNFLDKVGWSIFRKLRPFHLDEYGYDLVKKYGNSMKLVSKESFILSVKGSWEMINATADILKANKRINNTKVNERIPEIFELLKITNINDYLT
jgi:hypothetical protein